MLGDLLRLLAGVMLEQPLDLILGGLVECPFGNG